MTTALTLPTTPSVLQLVRHFLEQLAPPTLATANLTEVFEVLQLQAAALASEALLAERTGVSLSDAVNDAQGFPRLARFHTFCADILTLQLPPEMQQWTRDLYARPPDTAFFDGIQLHLGRLMTDPEVSAAERALAGVGLFEWVRRLRSWSTAPMGNSRCSTFVDETSTPSLRRRSAGSWRQCAFMAPSCAPLIWGMAAGAVICAGAPLVVAAVSTKATYERSKQVRKSKTERELDGK
jgi:hypothetical protein